jgi:DNA-binding MarR family transcriptional regulator
MVKKPAKAAWNQPGWLQFTAIEDSVVPHHVPYPLVRRLEQIFAWTAADAVAGELTETPPQYAAVAVLADFPAIDQRRLAILMGLDRTNVGQLIDQLEAKGLVERRINASDRRARALHLTAEGKALRRRLRPKMVAAQARVLSPLAPAEQDMLIDLLIRVVRANESNARPGAGRRKPGPRQSSSNEKSSSQSK